MVYNFLVEIARHGFHEAPQWVEVTIQQDEQSYEQGMSQINKEFDQWNDEQYPQWKLAKQQLWWDLQASARDRCQAVIAEGYPGHYIRSIA